MALFVFSLCPFDISVDVGTFVIALSQISSFLSSKYMHHTVMALHPQINRPSPNVPTGTYEPPALSLSGINLSTTYYYTKRESLCPKNPSVCVSSRLYPPPVCLKRITQCILPSFVIASMWFLNWVDETG